MSKTWPGCDRITKKKKFAISHDGYQHTQKCAHRQGAYPKALPSNARKHLNKHLHAPAKLIACRIDFLFNYQTSK